MSLLLWFDLIFYIVNVFGKIQYKFKNVMVFEILEKLIIATTNPLIWYLIVKISYIRLLLINILIFSSIQFKISKKISYIYNDSRKSRWKTRFC